MPSGSAMLRVAESLVPDGRRADLCIENRATSATRGGLLERLDSWSRQTARVSAIDGERSADLTSRAGTALVSQFPGSGMHRLLRRSPAPRSLAERDRASDRLGLAAHRSPQGAAAVAARMSSLPALAIEQPYRGIARSSTARIACRRIISLTIRRDLAYFRRRKPSSARSMLDIVYRNTVCFPRGTRSRRLVYCRGLFSRNQGPLFPFRERIRDLRGTRDEKQSSRPALLRPASSAPPGSAIPADGRWRPSGRPGRSVPGSRLEPAKSLIFQGDGP